jgi:hypothetical protein
MAFTPSTTIVKYTKAPVPVLKESDRRYYDTELRKMSQTLASVVEAVEEIREYLQTLP